MSKPEKPLTGGNTTPVARLGDQVLREAGPWTASVQRLLTHLRANGVTWCPEPQGWHPDGRESVSYLKGKVPTPPVPEWVWDEEVLTTAARWLRELHDLTTDFDTPESVWRAPRRQPAEVMCHNDFAPYNFVFKEHRLIGVIDWDFAAPGPRLWDLAYLAYRIVPLVGPGHADAPRTPQDLSRRLRLLMSAYGTDAAIPDLLSTVVARLEDLADFSRAQATKHGKKSGHLEDAATYESDAAFLRGLLR